MKHNLYRSRQEVLRRVSLIAACLLCTTVLPSKADNIRSDFTQSGLRCLDLQAAVQQFIFTFKMQPPLKEAELTKCLLDKKLLDQSLCKEGHFVDENGVPFVIRSDGKVMQVFTQKDRKVCEFDLVPYDYKIR